MSGSDPKLVGNRALFRIEFQKLSCVFITIIEAFGAFTISE